MADTACAGWLVANMSSASCRTELKFCLLNSVDAIPARTFPGSCLFHKVLMTAGQHLQSSSFLQMSSVSDLANSLGFPVKTLDNALSTATSGLAQKFG